MATIMVVDDHPLNRQFLVTLLSYGGHRLIEASDGLQALELVRTEHPDLVITDILMPSMNGIEFTTQLKADRATAATPVIFYTATYRLPEAREMAAGCGVSSVLTKPSAPETILNAVNQALRLPAFSSPSLPPGTSHLEASGLRLSALVELGLQMVCERNPEHLLNTVCSGARDLLETRYACIGILNDERNALLYLQTSGLHVAAQQALCSMRPLDGVFGRLIENQDRIHLRATNAEIQELGLPAEHPPINAFLGVPIASPNGVFGWMYLADKTGGRGSFDADDERIALSLAANVAVCYENLKNYNDLQQEKARLETEVDRRISAEEEIRRFNTELEERVRKRTQQLEAANKELEAFSYSVSHDLRSPLQAIEGLSRLLLLSAALPTQEHGFVEKIRTNTQKMKRMVDDLLNFSRLSRKPLVKVPTSPREIVEHALEALYDEQQRHHVQITIGELPPCHADPALLERVFVNLLSNAFKFTRKRDIALIQVGSERATHEVAYFVRDNGEGFDMECAKNLFGVFQRLHSGNEFEGTGVGLAIVQRIIERHGGRIWAEAAPHKGATFYFTIPQPS